MFTRNKNVKKRFTPIRGKRETALKIKRFFIMLLTLVVLIGAFFAFRKAAGLFFDTEERPKWLEWHIKKINITGDKGDILYEVEKYVPFSEGDAVTHSEAAGLERVIKSNLKELKKISVWRNFFNGNLNISIEKHQPFVRLKTGQKNYLAEEGGLVFSDDKSPEYEKLFAVSIKGQIKAELLPKEFVELIKALKAENGLAVKEIFVDVDNSTFSLNLEEGSADMGALKNGPEKLVYLKRVLQQGGKHEFKKPFDINFEYFNDGKIYLKPTM